MRMSIVMNQDDFLTEQSSSLTSYRIPLMHESIKISFLCNILLLFMGTRIKLSVHQAVVIPDCYQHHLPGAPLILNFLGISSSFFFKTIFTEFLPFVKMYPTFTVSNYLLELVIPIHLILSKEVECHSHAIFSMF